MNEHAYRRPLSGLLLLVVAVLALNAGITQTSDAQVPRGGDPIKSQNVTFQSIVNSACLVDTTQADFQAGSAINCDLTTSPGDVILLDAPQLDQSNTAGTTTGTGFGTPSWTGQTFIPARSGHLTSAEVQVFCIGCGATPPNL